MSDKTTETVTNCAACGKKWEDGETFICIRARLSGPTDSDDGNPKRSRAVSVDIAIFCEDCAMKIPEWDVAIKSAGKKLEKRLAYLSKLEEMADSKAERGRRV
jgi:hypothetical protein